MTRKTLLAIEPAAQQEIVNAPSNRSVGVVFAVVFALIGGWPLFGGELPHWWALAVAGAFALASAALPRVLWPLNWVWFRIGLLLHRIVSPLVMGAVFFLCVTPTAWIMRLRGKDVLSLKPDPTRVSYWILREPPGPEPQTMKHQF